MRRPLAALLVAVAIPTAAPAQTAPIGVHAPQPPAGASTTANLLFTTMMSVARAAASNPQAASTAALNYSIALQRYGSGDLSGAQSSAIQAMIEANTPQQTAIPTIVPLVPGEHPRVATYPASSLAQIDADASIAQARGAVAVCTTAHRPEAKRANTLLGAAQHEDDMGQLFNAKVDAKSANDLCAGAR